MTVEGIVILIMVAGLFTIPVWIRFLGDVTGHFKVHHLRSLESAPLWRLGGVG